MKKNFFVSLMAVLFIMCLSSCGKQMPADVVEDFCDDLVEKDYEDATEYIYVSTGEMTKAEKIEWVKFCEKTYNELQEINVVYTRINKKETKAEVDVEVKMTEKTRKDMIRLIKEGEEWKVVI